MSGVGPKRRRDRGQATVELALALPVVVLAALLVVQVGLVVRAQILTVHAAREGARAAAVDDRADAAAAAARVGGLDPKVLRVARAEAADGRTVTVEVTYRMATDVPVVGAALPDLTLHAKATMQVESRGDHENGHFGDT